MDLKNTAKKQKMYTVSAFALVFMGLDFCLMYQIQALLYEGLDKFYWLLLISSVLVLVFICIAYFYVISLVKNLDQAQQNSLKDALTLLHNRRSLNDYFPKLLRESFRHQDPISILLIDIDMFRKFNNLYGHQHGDLVLQAVAQTLAKCCRRPMDFICRWGGEEFVAVLPRTNSKAAKKIAQDMLNHVRNLKRIHGISLRAPITVSIGYVTQSEDTVNIDSNSADVLISAADQAMQQAKQLGRNQSYCFEDDHKKHSLQSIKQYGSAAVEFGLLLPMLMLMMDITVELGLMIYDQSVLTSATHIAARAGITQSTNKLSTQQIAYLAMNDSSNKLISMNKDQLPVVTVTQSLNPVFQTPLKVTMSYNYQGFLLGGILSAIQVNPVLVATTVMYNE